MKKCRAFYPIAGSRTAWLPCVRAAENGSSFCRRHGNAIFGVVLGALVYAEPVDEAVKFPEEPVPVWMRRVERKSEKRKSNAETPSTRRNAEIREGSAG
jgi:hypothetical protein